MSSTITKTILLAFGLVFILILALVLITQPAETTQETDISKLANPASVYCVEKGGKLGVKRDAYGEYGICIFDDGSECEEWDYYRGQCQPTNVPLIRL